MSKRKTVTPFVGVWIETQLARMTELYFEVTPFVGVWIETILRYEQRLCRKSHTIRGCVD